MNYISKSLIDAYLATGRSANGRKISFASVDQVMRFATEDRSNDTNTIVNLYNDIFKNGIREEVIMGYYAVVPQSKLDQNLEGTRPTDFLLGIEEGHHRVIVARMLGMTHIPVTLVRMRETPVNIDSVNQKYRRITLALNDLYLHRKQNRNAISIQARNYVPNSLMPEDLGFECKTLLLHRYSGGVQRH